MELDGVKELTGKLEAEVGKVIKGQQEIIRQTLVGLVLQGHVLLESVPGLGKSLLAGTLARIIGGQGKRIQFTPDLMPSDIVGTTVYRMETGEFQVRKGPVFTHILLADEVNRASAKTQSALLEAMAERQVSLGNETFRLESPFFCIATQNPIEMEGTYPLPEAQQDRFMMKLVMDYPSEEEEKAILRGYSAGFDHRDIGTAGIVPICTTADIDAAGKAVRNVKVDDKIIDYITALVRATREHARFSFGASPRGSVALYLLAQATAAFDGRDFVVPDDVKEFACPALRHRVMLSPEAEVSGQTADEILKEIIGGVKVPH
jgi:MoxR-like ATPase